MSEMFNIKTPEITKEVSEGEFETIFNINIWSRYDDDYELAEMLWFCKYLNKVGLTACVNELFYDSKSDICSIKLIKSEQENILNEDEITAIRIIAQLTIRRFEIYGVIGHKNSYLANTLKVLI